MHNIVLQISIYLFSWLHVLCDLSPINNARKHAISAVTVFANVYELPKVQFISIYVINSNQNSELRTQNSEFYLT